MADDSKLWGAIAYLLGILGGVLAYLVKKDDPYVKFHAVQSILFNISLIVIFVVLGVMSFIFWPIGLISPLVWLVWLLAWLFLMWKAYSGEKYKLPVLGAMAEQYAK